MQNRFSRRKLLAGAAGLAMPGVRGGRMLCAAPAPRVGGLIFEEVPPAVSGITWVHENAM